MPSFRSLTLWALAAASLSSSTVLCAQEPLGAAPSGVVFMPRFDWQMSANRLWYDDHRFMWDAHWTGDLDVISLERMRVTFLGDYQALLGDQFQPFDPYQSTYRLEGSASLFFGRTEIALLMNHESRHLGDRPKRRMIAENSVGPRVLHRFGDAQRSFDIRGEVRTVTEKSYVDYTWMNLFEVTFRQRVNRRMGLYGRGSAELIAVDPDIAGRDTQRGGRGEGGVRFVGARASVELFGGYEQVIDADPLDRITRRWAFVGLRLMGN